jgi:phosphomannomutase
MHAVLAIADCSNAADGWRVFSGNEMGTILGAYLWTAYRRRHPDSPAGCVHMMNSVVSTKFLRTMAQREGFVHHQTLTGFKYMGSLISELRTTTPSDVFLFAFEESIGFMPGTALDKDGILAAGMFAECAAYVREVEGRSLVQYLADIYKQYVCV